MIGWYGRLGDNIAVLDLKVWLRGRNRMRMIIMEAIVAVGRHDAACIVNDRRDVLP